MHVPLDSKVNATIIVECINEGCILAMYVRNSSDYDIPLDNIR